MKKLILPLVLIIALLILSCSDDDKTTGPEDSATTLFSVKVVDSDGAPLSGIRIGSVNHYNISYNKDGFQNPNPSTDIGFSIPERRHVKLAVYDYYRRLIKVLEDRVFEAGSYTITWDATDSLGSPLISGFYFYVMSVYTVDTHELLFDSERAMVLELGPDLEATIIGSTGDDGIFATNDTLFFPCLLGNQPEVEVADEFGSQIGYFEYTDTVTISLSVASDPGTFETYDRKLRKTVNNFEFTWDR